MLRSIGEVYRATPSNGSTKPDGSIARLAKTMLVLLGSALVWFGISFIIHLDVGRARV